MSHNNVALNFSHATDMKKNSLTDLDREIEMGDFRLRYIQLMRDVQKTLGEEDAINLIRESEDIWKKLVAS